MRIDDRGSMTLWMLGLTVMLLAFGGLALDFWRGLALQRELASVADSAVIAAASGIDEEHYRATGRLILDPDRSLALASESIEFQDVQPTDLVVTVAPDASEVTVLVVGKLKLGLLGMLIDDAEPLTIRATASASPRLVP